MCLTTGLWSLSNKKTNLAKMLSKKFHSPFKKMKCTLKQSICRTQIWKNISKQLSFIMDHHPTWFNQNPSMPCNFHASVSIHSLWSIASLDPIRNIPIWLTSRRSSLSPCSIFSIMCCQMSGAMCPLRAFRTWRSVWGLNPWQIAQMALKLSYSNEEVMLETSKNETSWTGGRPSLCLHLWPAKSHPTTKSKSTLATWERSKQFLKEASYAKKTLSR